MTVRRAAVLAGASVPAAIAVGDLFLGPLGALVIVGAGVAVGWRFIPGFWRTVLRAALAGGLAGLLVLGPGYRVAMRLVAIADSDITPEFTIGGTGFLVVGIGLMFGGVTTTWVTIVTKTFEVSRRMGVTALTVITFAMLFADSEVRSELTEMGFGPLVNVPMFLGVTIAWAWLADRWARPAEQTISPDTLPVPVP